jgi:tRNA threonylcarbamoyl adenosine modification protein (Sua5/YciO/YrdC/YwlC family)
LSAPSAPGGARPLDAAARREAERSLRAGAVVGLPTDTVYGLGAVAREAHAVARLFALKGRPADVAVAVLVADLAQAEQLAAPGRTRLQLVRVAAAHWPGALTVVVALDPALGLSLGGDGVSVGLRCPDDDDVRALARALGPLAVTSANLHGAPPATSAAQVAADFPGVFVADGGVRAEPPSTVLSLLSTPPSVLREGALAGAALLAELDD